MNFSITQRHPDGHLICNWVGPNDVGHSGYIAQSFDLTEHIEQIIRRVVRQELESNNA